MEGPEGGKRGEERGTAGLFSGLTVQERGQESGSWRELGLETSLWEILYIFNMGDTGACLHADGEESIAGTGGVPEDR